MTCTHSILFQLMLQDIHQVDSTLRLQVNLELSNLNSMVDNSGKVRIWDTVNEEHVLKCEHKPMIGMILDLAWTSDNQRMMVGGSGSGK